MEYYEVAEITLNLNSKGYEMGGETRRARIWARITKKPFVHAMRP